MQIVVPMSGFGERFRRAGYAVPKPLIEVEGKPIVAHVIDLFPGETDFIFICNQDHLEEPAYRMAETLKRYCPTGRIIGVPAHKLGPVGAVLKAAEALRNDAPTFVNYCDFTCCWDWGDFKRFVAETRCAGAVPAYRGFHPHSLGSTFYAYMRHDGGWMTDIQEKQPFTDTPTEEYASSGGYYFESGELCVSAFREVVTRDLSVNGEYYVSLACKVLAERGKSVGVYEVQHFMQWGTPQDLQEYEAWSDAFRHLAIDEGRRARQSGAVLVPMAGYGKRFADAGYALPKPLIPVSGRPMVIQATRDLPDAPATRFVMRADVPLLDEIRLKLRTAFVGASVTTLDRGTEGQAITCELGLAPPGMAPLDLEAPLTIGACDNAMLYDSRQFEALMEPGGPDALVWIVRGHADGRLRPHMFGWVETDEDERVTGVRVKQAPDDPAVAPMIVGAFTFRRAADFKACVDRLVARDERVNGEFYADSLLEDAVALGLDVRLFEIDHYLGWGTPNDLKTFEYWQSAFHKWPTHPYRLDKDRRIPPASLDGLKARYAAVAPPRPDPGRRPGVPPSDVATGAPAPQRAGGVLGEAMRFLPVGVAAVLLDLALYLGMTAVGAAPAPAKALSFVSGAVLAYAGNRWFTFRRRSGAKGFGLFWLTYLVSLGLNVAVNALVLRGAQAVGAPLALALPAGFVAATGLSAVTNFVGMKLLVFTGAERSPMDALA